MGVEHFIFRQFLIVVNQTNANHVMVWGLNMYKRCAYCGRFYNKPQELSRCVECEKEFIQVQKQVERHKKVLPFGVFERLLGL
jgi:hypothetical protein